MRNFIFDVRIADLLYKTGSDTLSGTTSTKIRDMIKQSPGPKGPGLLRSGLP